MALLYPPQEGSCYRTATVFSPYSRQIQNGTKNQARPPPPPTFVQTTTLTLSRRFPPYPAIRLPFPLHLRQLFHPTRSGAHHTKKLTPTTMVRNIQTYSKIPNGVCPAFTYTPRQQEQSLHSVRGGGAHAPKKTKISRTYSTSTYVRAAQSRNATGWLPIMPTCPPP